jgi:type III pantothenate kinase
MSYNLVIDQGNSTAKVAIFEGNSLVEHNRYETLCADDIDNIKSRYDISAAIYCSVVSRGEEIIVALRDVAHHVYELTSLLPLPVKLCYETPSTLGRDRIAAVAGAYAVHPGKTVLVVDAGTAVTYDVLTPDGAFLGGNIAPGLWMRAEALHSMTGRLPLVEVEAKGDVALWGQNTDDAIRTGVVRGVIAEINYYASQLPDDAVIMLTGGDAERLAQFLDSKIEVDPLLVNKGLNSILLYNEQL